MYFVMGGSGQITGQRGGNPNGLESAEGGGIETTAAHDIFPYTQVGVNKLVQLVTQQEETCTEYVQAEKVTTHVYP